MKQHYNRTVDDAEIERFTRMADEWWDESGKFKPLHQINPLRIQWIVSQTLAGSVQATDEKLLNLTPLKGLRLLDIGCGGGLISEPMRRLGAEVTGIDAGEKNIKIARLHAQKSGLDIDYRCMAAETLAEEAPAFFDVVLALEIVEHVADVPAFVAASCALLKPGGTLIYTTLNRTMRSYAMAIIGAEYVLRWLPRGTHDWHKFLKPSELCAQLRQNGIAVQAQTGMAYNPINGTWRLDAKDLGVNYLVCGRKSG